MMRRCTCYADTDLYRWQESDADTLSLFYDVGGIIAAVLAGWLSVSFSFVSKSMKGRSVQDRMTSRTPIVFAMLLLSSFALGGYSSECILETAITLVISK